MYIRLLPILLLKKVAAFTSLAASVLFLSVATTEAEIINYQWNQGSSGHWSNGPVWSPNAPDRIGAMAWGNLSRFDRVTVDGAYVVTNNVKTRFMTSNAGGLGGVNKTGTFNALTLINGGKVVIDSPLSGASDKQASFGISTSSNGYVRNALIGADSELQVIGSLLTGAQNATNDVSTWTINGTVRATEFWGQQGSGNISGNTQIMGGYVLNIDGGLMQIDGLFDWRSSNGMGLHGGEILDSVSTISTAQINLSNGGAIIVGSMASNWNESSNAFVNFVDNSGILTFGKESYSERSDVQSLIDNNHIRTVGGGVFEIQDDGSNWTVTVTAIPEASSMVLIMASIAAGLMSIRFYSKGRGN